MTECTNAEVKEALPDLLNGRLSALDTATMKAHVESCADCRAELELLRQARTSALLTPKMDAARIAASIPAYPRVQTHLESERPVSSRFRALRIAAVAAVVAAGGLVWSMTGRDSVRPVAQNAVSTESPVAVPATSVAQSAEPAPSPTSQAETQVASLSLVGGTGDLTDADLELLVSELDEMESMPAAEPQSFTNSVEDIASDEDSGI